MNIKLEHYRFFKEVALRKSISEASKRLFISQSAVSQSIKQLENELGVKLLFRNSKGVTLTPEGEMLFEYVNSAMTLLEVGEHKLSSMKKLEEGELRIGASDTISRYLILDKLEKFHNSYPKIKLQIVNRTTNQAIELLKSGKLDFAFVNLPYDDDSVIIKPYLEAGDIFVASPEAYDEKREYDFEELSKLPLILLERSSNSRRFVEKYFNEQGFKLKPEIELGSHDLLLEFAKIKLGISCVIKEFSSGYLESGELFELKLKNPIPKRQIGIAFLKGVSLSSAAEEFLATGDNGSAI